MPCRLSSLYSIINKTSLGRDLERGGWALGRWNEEQDIFLGVFFYLFIYFCALSVWQCVLWHYVYVEIRSTCVPHLSHAVCMVPNPEVTWQQTKRGGWRRPLSDAAMIMIGQRSLWDSSCSLNSWSFCLVFDFVCFVHAKPPFFPCRVMSSCWYVCV